ncbi:MAG TPA: hypothetical protein VF218_14245 [Acidothermaceae bacterium]|jgi:hypothetical protein
MQDFTTAAVTARRAELRKIAGHRRERRARRAAPEVTKQAAKSVAHATTAGSPAAVAAGARRELNVACTR